MSKCMYVESSCSHVQVNCNFDLDNMRKPGSFSSIGLLQKIIL